MTLEVSAIDAVIGGIATAFFGGLLAGGAYLLKQQLALREQVATLSGQLQNLRAVQPAVEAVGIERLRLEGSRNPEDEFDQGGT